MKKKFTHALAVIISLTLIFSTFSMSVCAVTPDLPVADGSEVVNDTLKFMYNSLNQLVEMILKVVNFCIVNPSDWEDQSEYNSAAVYFMEGRTNYRTEPEEGSYWSLGFASESFVPSDINDEKYYIGRDVTNRIAKGVYDDNRIRVAVIDDNSGDGALVIGAVDSLGVTSTDVRAIRKGVLEYCETNNIKVSAIDIAATHSHTALDTQGVGTEFFYKLFFGGINNISGGALYQTSKFDAANSFKSYFITQSIKAVEEAFEDVEKGKLYYTSIDASNYMSDKRDLIAKEDIPPMASLYFVPDSGSEATYITEVGCHPTSFSASNYLVSGDYIYYLDKHIKETEGANVVIVQGALGQISRDNIDTDYTGLSEYEAMGAETKRFGEIYADLIMNAEYDTELQPILNVKNKEIWLEPDNSLLVLACEIQLVNNKVYTDENNNGIMASEMGYIEFGHKVGFATFPGELYPEVFWGAEITGDVSWNGESWPYSSLHNSVEGVDVYPISLMNDAVGYVVTDNYFAFFGHIAGVDRQVADELLSVGSHMGSFLVEEYLDLIDNLD